MTQEQIRRTLAYAGWGSLLIGGVVLVALLAGAGAKAPIDAESWGRVLAASILVLLVTTLVGGGLLAASYLFSDQGQAGSVAIDAGRPPAPPLP